MRIERDTPTGPEKVIDCGYMAMEGNDLYSVRLRIEGLTPEGDPIRYLITLTRNELALINKFS